MTYLDQKTAQNLGIFLSGFKHRKKELLTKLSTVDEKDGGLTSEQISSLSKLVEWKPI